MIQYLNIRFSAVSYTHLDVYKRQMKWNTDILANLEIRWSGHEIDTTDYSVLYNEPEV